MHTTPCNHNLYHVHLDAERHCKVATVYRYVANAASCDMEDKQAYMYTLKNCIADALAILGTSGVIAKLGPRTNSQAIMDRCQDHRHGEM